MAAQVKSLKNSHPGSRHMHWKQTEHFEVEQGIIAIYKNGKVLAVTKADGMAKVPAGTR